jgi:gas vesicle protein
MRRIVSFIIGTVLGGLAGAVIALLFTPASGSELRAQIRDRTENLVVDIRQATATKRIELQNRLDTLRAPKA